jgi:protein-disulfide isomerase
MSNRQARREQMRANRQQRAQTSQSRPPRSSGGGGGSPRKSGGPLSSILSQPFVLIAGVLVVALLVVLGIVVWMRESSDGEFVSELESAHANLPTELADGKFLGEEDAPITLTSYEDFQCPFCLRYSAEDEPELIQEFVKTGEVRLEFKHLPILGTESLRAAKASVCMAEQNKFWDFQNRLFLTQAEADQFNDEQIDVGRFSDENLRQYAIDLGADATAYDTCFASQATLDTVQADMAEASSFGIQGTPGFAINGRPLGSGAPSDIEGWRTLFDQVLAEESASPAASESPTEASETATPTP